MDSPGSLKKKYISTFFILNQKKTIYQTKKNFTAAWKNWFFNQRKNFLYFPEKISHTYLKKKTNFRNEKKFL